MKTRTQFLALDVEVAVCREMLNKAPKEIVRKEKGWGAVVEVGTTPNSKLICKAKLTFVNAMNRNQVINVRVCRCSTINGECISLNVSETDQANLYFNNPESEKKMYAAILDFGKFIHYACENDLSNLVKKEDSNPESKGVLSWIAHQESGCLFIGEFTTRDADQLCEWVADLKCDINDLDALLNEYYQLCDTHPYLRELDCEQVAKAVENALPF